MKIVRLILGDQLHQQHSWFDEVNEDVTYIMAEMRQETDYVKHHIQKVVGFFSAMRNFKNDIIAKGHHVDYLHLKDKNNPQKLEQIISAAIKKYKAERFEYQLPDEYRLDQQLKTICQNLSVETQSYDSEHFYTTRFEVKNFFANKKLYTMENFYRMMRKKHDIMMIGGEPDGGKWNFDHSNRKKWTGKPAIPEERNFHTDVSDILKEISQTDVTTFGNIEPEDYNWPTSRAKSVEVLDYFCQHLLIHFGDYQDALHTEQKFLFHSRLSFAMNSKQLSPKEVIDAVLEHYYENTGDIHISQVEGFIRQILGWREYMRGMYWAKMPEFKQRNKLNNHNKLPDFYWTGDTKMNCLKQAIGQSLEEAYAHHIQRLMITGNYALLTQTHPDEVDDWYLGIYIDAIEWVEITNTRGMSQFADGGLIATKPYVSSANYINKMGNYCSNCQYSHTKKVGEKACPFNALYWNFLDEKKEHFKSNHRMSMMMSLLNKKSAADLKALKERAQEVINHPERF